MTDDLRAAIRAMPLGELSDLFSERLRDAIAAEAPDAPQAQHALPFVWCGSCGYAHPVRDRDCVDAPPSEDREAGVAALTFAEFAATNRARCESPDGFGHALGGWSLSDWMLAATGEFGEAANVAKKLNRVRDGIPGNTQTPEELEAALADEFADAVIYLDLAAQSRGIDLGSAVASKFNRTSEKIGAPHRLAAQPDLTSKVAAAVPGEPCRRSRDDNQLCATHGGVFLGATCVRPAASPGPALDERLRQAVLRLRHVALVLSDAYTDNPARFRAAIDEVSAIADALGATEDKSHD